MLFKPIESCLLQARLVFGEHKPLQSAEASPDFLPIVSVICGVQTRNKRIFFGQDFAQQHKTSPMTSLSFQKNMGAPPSQCTDSSFPHFAESTPPMPIPAIAYVGRRRRRGALSPRPDANGFERLRSHRARTARLNSDGTPAIRCEANLASDCPAHGYRQHSCRNAKSM